MASLEELDATNPSHFTLSNKNLIIIARVREETVYFYDQLGPTTTVVLLAEPSCYAIKRIFLELMIDMGVTVIDLREKESFDKNYKMTPNSLAIIMSLTMGYNFDRIITHPKYPVSNDPQNRAIYDLVQRIISVSGSDNHFTYNKIGNNGIPILPCGVKKGILELYCKMASDDESVDRKMYDNYVSITSHISGLKKVLSHN